MTWTDRLDPAEASAVRDLARRSTDEDGVAPLGEELLLGLEGRGHRHLLLPADPPFVAYAGVAPDGSAELTVDPAHRGQGLGTELAESVLAENPDARLWAHGDLPAAQAVAGRTGLSRVRELLVLRRPLAGVDPDPEAPEGYRLRTFVPGQDEPALLALNAAAFVDHPEQGRLDEAGLARRTSQPWFDAEGLFLVVDAHDEPAAFHWTKVEDASTGVGEVYVVGVSPEHQGRGLGAYATAVGLAHLARLGLETVELYVEGDNDPALATYRRAGFERHAVHSMYARTA